MSAQAAHQLQAGVDARPQMRSAMDRIALVEIVRSDSAHEELLDVRSHDLEVVIDAAQQHRLISERNAGVSESFQGRSSLGG